jgi:hypothetical protein
MDHPVITRRDADRYGRTGDPGTGVDRTHGWRKQSSTALGFVDSGNAAARQAFNCFGICTTDISVDNVHGNTPDGI